MRCMMPFLPSTRSFWEGCAPAARRAPAAMWPGDVWHLWPGTYRHLWLALVIVVGLYAWDAKRSLPALTDLNLALEVAALVVVNVLPASTHSLAVVAAAPFLLEPLSSAAAYGRVAPWLRLLLGTPGLVATAVLHVSFLGILADRHRRAALDAARRGSWRPVPGWILPRRQRPA